ncbi:hypothetical protein KC573_04225, partial [candidate division WWE3 bacterium]|nr:hypothetical protein [candidate division WWE3 bacterium]
MDPQNTTPQQPTQNNKDLQSPANASDASGQPTVTLPQQPVSQQATPNQQISVGGSESSATIETQKSSEQVSNEPSPQTQQLIQSTSQLQAQARKAKNQGDIAGAVEQEKKILQQLSGLSPNPVNAPTTPTSSISKQQPVTQSTPETPPQKTNMVDSSDSQMNQFQETPAQAESQPVQSPQVPTQQEAVQSTSSVQSPGSQPVTQSDGTMVESPRKNDSSSVEEDILKGVQQKYSQFTTDAPSSNGIIKATTVVAPTQSVASPTSAGVNHDGFTDVKVVSEPQGTITLSPDPKKEEEGTFHRKFSQAPVTTTKTKTQKPEEQPAVQIAEGALGQAVAVS